MIISICIIPARGNSKRLLNKNILELNGIPLFMHSVDYARQNGIERIVVSTDSELIKQKAKEFNKEPLLI